MRVFCVETCTHTGAERVERSFMAGEFYKVSDSLAAELLQFVGNFEDASAGNEPDLGPYDEGDADGGEEAQELDAKQSSENPA